MENVDYDLLQKYLNFEPINSFVLEKLQSDALFMKLVLIQSNDPNYYFDCSYDLMTNFKFVSFVIKKFIDNKDFVDKVATNYIKFNHNLDDGEYYSFLINICKIFEGSSYQEDYKEILLCAYHRFSALIKRFKENNPEKSKQIGMGFFKVQKDYYNYPLVINFFAKSIINSIITGENSGLEDLLHSLYEDRDKLIQIGFRSCLLDIIGKYDLRLKNYVTCHINVLNEFESSFEEIISKWTSYIDQREQKRFELLKDVFSFCLNKWAHLYEDEIWMYSIAIKLNDENWVKEYLSEETLASRELCESIDKNIDIFKMPLLQQLKDIYLRIKQQKVISYLEFYDILTEPDSKKCKVLKIDFNPDNY